MATRSLDDQVRAALAKAHVHEMATAHDERTPDEIARKHALREAYRQQLERHRAAQNEEA